MYQGWITHTWNTVKGECPHGCHYCYMKRWGKQSPLHFDEKELKTDLGSGNTIFVGSSCDMFANEVSNKWIIKTLHRCEWFDNQYLFQTKNPGRFYDFERYLPESVILGTTIESDIEHTAMGNAPPVVERALSIMSLAKDGYETTITIEPIMDFNVDWLVGLIARCDPDWINIGSNTNHKVKLPEPSPEKVLKLIEKLKKITEVKIKSNLKRLTST